MHGDANDLTGLNDLLRDLNILGAGFSILAWMIVGDYYRGCCNNSASENFAWVNEAAIEYPLRNDFKADNKIRCVQPEYDESFTDLVFEEGLVS